MTTYPRRSPLQAIRVFCVECQGDSFQGVSECADTACPFHPYRHGTALSKGGHRPIGTIKRYCHEYCQGGVIVGSYEVKDCGGDKAALGPCPVFPFRLGMNPNISEETREKHRQRVLHLDPLGLNLSQNSLNHTPFDAPESTERGAG
ncbi:MAG: hypothetical protein LBM00_03285 [Deltaproteobacteria bacterium]|jgi:hypothetical protein|nr:hypothetical protein [Deltaproteobacteria bacterium]